MVKRAEQSKQHGRLSPDATAQAGKNRVRNPRKCRISLHRAVSLARVLGLAWTFCVLGVVALAQSLTTTTVQGTVYTAAGQPASGTLQISWPAFTTAAGQAVAAGRTIVPIGADGFVSVNLAPNVGSMPAGLYYTVVYNLNDGSTNTEYWTVPAAAQATIGAVRAQLMPAAQAVQAVNKAYVDQAVANVSENSTESELSIAGGTLSGPLYLSGDPTTTMQAADKHYVDNTFAQAIPLSGGSASGPLTAVKLGGAYQVDQFPGSDFAAKLQACINGLSTTYGGTCDARNFTGALTMGTNVTISTANVTVNLPCATISTTNQIVITAGTRNVTFHGCALLGTSAAGGNAGGTVFLYSGTGAMFKVGDPTYAADTAGFHIDNTTINLTNSTSASTEAIAVYRSQEIDLDHLYLLGNANQTAITLDGTGNYTGGSLSDDHISGFLIGLNTIGHQITNSATTDWVNATAFLRLHIDCPTSSGSPETGTIGVNLVQGDGNTFTGGDIEGCSTALHLGPNAQNNTIVGLRNENSTMQVEADAGSQYNSWITAGTMFTGKLTDNGTHNSFWDSFHRGFNGVNGDIYRSQADSTVTDHQYLGVGNGNVRGRQTEYVTDVPGSAGSYQNAWLMGLSDGTTGLQTYQIEDLLNNVNRISVGQYNNGSSTNNQTVVNSAGTGAIVLNGSNNAGTGGVVFGSGGAASSTVATINSLGNAQFNGTLEVGGTAQSAGTLSVKNNADAEVDYYLQPGATASQKGSFTYKDYNGNSQWFLLKDTSNNWALNSAPGNIDVLKAYQNTNSGDTYLDTSNSSGHIRLNYETGAGSETDIYSGGSSNLDAAFLSPTAIKLPGLAAASSKYCLQIDNSGYITNTGSPCGTSAATTTIAAVNSGTQGQLAVYSTTGTALTGASNASINGNINIKALPPSISATSAKGDGVLLQIPAGNVPLTQGSTTLNCGSGSNCNFQAADQGKLLCVGPRAGNQPGYPTAPQPQELCTTIASVVSSTQITMADPWPYSGTPTSGTIYGVYATDDWPALNAAFVNSTSTRSRQIFLPCGIYGLSKSILQGQTDGVNPQVILGAAPGSACVVLWYMGGGPSGTPPSLYTGKMNGKIAGTTTTATTTSGSTTVTVASAYGAYVGQGITGSGIPSGTTISAINGTTLTLSAAATATASNVSVQFVGLSYVLLIQGATDVQNMEIHGNIYVQEGVIDMGTSGTRTNLTVNESTDYAYMVLGAVGWSGRDINVKMPSFSILPQNNGFYNAGLIDLNGPNVCISCTISYNTGTAIHIDMGTIDFVDLQASADNNLLYVGSYGRYGQSGGILECVLADSTNNCLSDIYGWAQFDNIGISGALTVESTGMLKATKSNFASNLPLNVKPGGKIYAYASTFPTEYNDFIDSSSTEHIEGSINLPNQYGWVSLHSSNIYTGDTYTEAYGDWNLTGTCASYASGSNCAVYPLVPRALSTANASWRAVFRGQWTLSNGTMLTTVPEVIELTSTNNTINLGGGKTVTVIQNTNTSYAQAGQLVMYTNTSDVQFTGSIFIYPNTAAAQPSVSYQSGTFEMLGGGAAATLAAGAAAGASPAVACAASHSCTALSGTVTLTTGTGTAAGALLTITAPVAHQYLPDCQASVVTTAAPYTPLPVLPSYTTSTWTINVGTAPAASTAYTITYTCPGS